MQEFLKKCRFYFKYAFFFSLFVNLLQLTFPIYMLQVYDKVLTSYNLSTLAVITIAAVICLVVLALLEWIRSRLLVRSGIEFDHMLSGRVMRENLNNATLPSAEGVPQGSLRDVQTLRTFLGGNAIFAFFDLPWMPLYFLLIFILHPALGGVAVIGGVVVLILGILNDRVTRKKLETANNLNAVAGTFVGSALRNAGIVRSMGMVGSISTRWENINRVIIDLQTNASHSAGLLHSISKSIRVGLQVMIYAVGAYLAVMHVSTAGAMIAASIVMGRALAPIDQAMGSYKQSLEARAAYKRLKEMLEAPEKPAPMDLPVPRGDLAVEDLSLTLAEREIIKNVSFKVAAGQSLAIIGPSASGKSTLCKLMLGLWPATSGKVRIDGADLGSWDMEKLGPYVGYLPQDVELFTGSIAENIARMGEVDPQKVLVAAQLAGVHDMILRLPKGYDTQIGERGTVLSGGQRQRIGLARALYGIPRVIVLDEPNSNLDEEGDRGLVQALLNLKQVKSTVILVTHKPSVLSIMDNILVMQEGQLLMYGERQKILNALAAMQKDQQARQQQAQQQARQQQAQQQVQAATRQASLQSSNQAAVTGGTAKPDDNRPDDSKPGNSSEDNSSNE